MQNNNNIIENKDENKIIKNTDEKDKNNIIDDENQKKINKENKNDELNKINEKGEIQISSKFHFFSPLIIIIFRLYKNETFIIKFKYFFS